MPENGQPYPGGRDNRDPEEEKRRVKGEKKKRDQSVVHRLIREFFNRKKNEIQQKARERAGKN